LANYPTADPSFSNKSANQTIASAHINAVQDEIVAIGSALRGTLQHDVTIASGKSLNVVGTSTFTGGVVCSSNVTLSGQARCVLNKTSTMSIASGSFGNVAWETEVADVGGMHAANSSLITIPTGCSGTYHVVASAQFAASSVGSRAIRVNQSGSEIVGGRVQIAAAPGANATVIQTHVVVVADAGATFSVDVYQDSGSTLSLFDALFGHFSVCRMY
jgi:hypothetical protein